ncbi:MAG: hypothetical protein QOK43_3002 [Acidimicrobiaceae bacterium]|nr:hypothetical protein [Acidimicrobiaceae bacterium]
MMTPHVHQAADLGFVHGRVSLCEEPALLLFVHHGSVATAYLVHGFLGAGKTTFAEALAQSSGGIRLSLDEWYLRLFADAPTEHLDAASWKRLDAMMADMWPQMLRSGVDVVLDFGFWTRPSRDRARSAAAAVGADTILYLVTCDDAVALGRCLARNSLGGPSFIITPAGFEEMRSRFEPLGHDEAHVLVET